jgi:hypothetical protein
LMAREIRKLAAFLVHPVRRRHVRGRWLDDGSLDRRCLGLCAHRPAEDGHLPAADVAYIAVAGGVVNAVISQLRPIVGAKLAVIRKH